MAKVTPDPRHRTAQILSESKTSEKESKQTAFHTANARMVSFFCVNLLFLPSGRMLPQWWVVFRVVKGTLPYHWALCPRCAGTAPLCDANRTMFCHTTMIVDHADMYTAGTCVCQVQTFRGRCRPSVQGTSECGVDYRSITYQRSVPNRQASCSQTCSR